MNWQEKINEFIPLLEEQQRMILDLLNESRHLHMQLHALEKKRAAQALAGPSWTADLLAPLLHAVETQLPGWHWQPTELTRQVLPAEATVFFYRDNLPADADTLAPKNCVYLSFYTGDLHKGELFFKTRYPLSGKKKPSVNGVFRPSKEAQPVQSVEQVIAILKKRIAIADLLVNR